MLLKGLHKCGERSSWLMESMRASWGGGGGNVIEMGRALVGWDRSQTWKKKAAIQPIIPSLLPA